MKRKIWAVLVLILAYGAGSVAAAEPSGGKVTLRYHFNVNDTYRVKLEFESNTAQHFTGYGMFRTMSGEIQYLSKVVSVDEQGAALTDWTCESVSFTERTPFEIHTSQEPVEGLPGNLAMVSRMTGQSFRLRIGPDGETSVVPGEKKVVIDSKDLKAPNLMNLLLMARENPWEKNIKEFLGKLFAILPPDPVGTGDSWRKALYWPMIPTGFATNFNLNGTQFGTEQTLLTAGGTVDIRFSRDYQVNDEQAETFRSKADYQLKGTSAGTVQLGAGTGWLKEAAFATQLSGELDRSGKKTPLTVEMKLKFSSVKI